MRAAGGYGEGGGVDDDLGILPLKGEGDFGEAELLMFWLAVMFLSYTFFFSPSVYVRHCGRLFFPTYVEADSHPYAANWCVERREDGSSFLNAST